MVSTVLKQVFQDLWPYPTTFPPEKYPDLTGKIVLITGCNTGIGYESAKALLLKNATVIFVNRNIEKSKAAVEKIEKELNDNSLKDKIILITADLSDLESIKPAVEEIKYKVDKIHYTILNAGIMQPPPGTMSKQGYEPHVATNVLGHQLLVTLIQPLISKAISPDFSPRVIWLSSVAHLSAPKPQQEKLDYGVFTKPATKESNIYLYGQSKVAAIYQAYIYGEKYKEDGIISIPVHPGFVLTELSRTFTTFQNILVRIFHWAPVYGSYTELFATLHPEITVDYNDRYIGPWGVYQEIRTDVKKALNDGTAQKFWDWSEEQIKPYI